MYIVFTYQTLNDMSADATRLLNHSKPYGLPVYVSVEQKEIVLLLDWKPVEDAVGRLGLIPTHIRTCQERPIAGISRWSKCVDGSAIPVSLGPNERLISCWPFEVPYRMGDFRLVDLFVQMYRGTVLYLSDIGEFRRWDGRKWIGKRAEDKIYFGFLYSEFLSRMTDDQLPKDRVKCYSERTMKTTQRLLIEDPRIATHGDIFDQTPSILNTPSGVVHLPTGRVLELNPNHRCARTTRVASTPTAVCPTFDIVMKRMADGDEELLQWDHIRMGAFLSGENPEQLAWFWQGSGSNGKSTLMNVLHRVLGDYVAMASPETFLEGHFVGGNRGDLIDLIGARVVMTSEPDDGRALDGAAFKRFTGSDWIIAAPKYGKEVQFRPQWKLVMATNRLPKLKNSDYGIRRRVQVRNFTYEFTEKNYGIEDTLVAEGAGILKWLLEGARKWYEMRHVVPVPKSVELASLDYREQTDSVYAWIVNACTVSKDESVMGGDAYKSYREFCEEQGIAGLGGPNFGLSLKEYITRAKNPDLVFTRTKKGMVYGGIAPRKVSGGDGGFRGPKYGNN